MSKEHSIALVGIVVINPEAVLSKTTVATSQTASKVSYFSTVNGKITVKIQKDGSVFMSTNKGKYTLKKHPTLNIWTGVCKSTKVHVSLKKIVGKIIYWK